MAAPNESLIGTAVNDCDTDNFDPGEIDNEIFIQGAGSIGLKVSASTSTFITTTLAGSPYDFAVVNSGEHIIIWVDALNPVNNFGIYLQEGTDTGRWTIPPPAGYTGGFIPLIINPDSDFSVVGGTWTTAGNPAQLNNITGMGAYFDIAGSIMGNFHNALCDQFTIGEGLRVEDGDATTPGNWDGLKDFDEDTNQYGWVRQLAGAYVVQGKIRVGPATGNNNCKFQDADQVVTFLDNTVASGFYEISVEEPGTGTTDFDQNGMIIRAENADVARWSITLDPGPDYDETDSVYGGFDVMELNNNTTLTRVKLDNGNSIIQSGANIDQCTILNSNLAGGVALIKADNPALITTNTFQFSTTGGHAVEFTKNVPSSFDFSGNVFTGNWGGTPGNNLVEESGSTDAMVLNSSGKALTISILANGTIPSARNTGSGSTTTFLSSVTMTVTCKDRSQNPIQGVQVGIFRQDTELELMNEATNASGIASESFNFIEDTPVIIRARSSSGSPAYIPTDTTGTITSTGLTAEIIMDVDDIIQ